MSTPRTRNMEASNLRKKLIEGLKADGYINTDYTVTFFTTCDNGDGSTETITKTMPLTDFVGLTEAEVKGPKAPTPKPIGKEAVQLALDAGTLSDEDLEAMLKARKEAAKKAPKA